MGASCMYIQCGFFHGAFVEWPRFGLFVITCVAKGMPECMRGFVFLKALLSNSVFIIGKFMGRR